MKIIFIFIIISINIYSQENHFNNQLFISSPDSETYTDREIWRFKKDSLIINNITKNKNNSYSYRIINNQLTLNDSIYLGTISFKEKYFRLYYKDKSFLQYSKLIPTKVVCNNEELGSIINSSDWILNNNNKEQFHISRAKRNTERSIKILNRLVKIDNTYILFVNDSWNYPISVISKNKIEFSNFLNNEKVKTAKRLN